MPIRTFYDDQGRPVQIDVEDDDVQVDDSDDGDQGGSPRTTSDFVALRKANSETKRERAARERLEKNYAFLRAGIDPEAKEGIAPYFVQGYTGELTPEAIRAAAQAAGLIQTQQDPAVQQQQDALTAQQRIAGAATDAVATPTQEAQQRQALQDAYNAGGMEGLTAALQAAGIPRALN